MKKWLILGVGLVLFFRVSQVIANEDSALNTASASAREAFQKAREHVRDLTQTHPLVRPTLKIMHPTIASRSAQDRCEFVNTKINSRLNFYNDHNDQFTNRFQGLRQHLADFVTHAKARGCDTTQIEKDLTAFDTQVTAFAAAFRDFVTNLQGTRSYVCGASQGKFAGQVLDARQKLLTAKQQALDLRNFVNNTMKPDAQLLMKSCKQVLPTPVPTGE